jgi:hypothetical protein
MTPTNAVVLRDASVVPAPQIIEDVQRLGKMFAASGFFQDSRDMAQAAVKVLAGAELGIPPVAAMMGINIIKGKVALGANLIASRVKAHGYDFRVKRLDNTGCVLEFLGKKDDLGKRLKLGESSFLEEDAKLAGLTGGENYRKYARNMYFSRAMSNGYKWFTPEVTSGMPVYTPEEMGANVDADGEIIPEQPKQAEVADRRIAEERGKLAELKKPPAPVDPEELPEVVQAWKFMSQGIKQTIEAFASTKASMIESMGSAGESEYYRILERHGVKHANEFVKGPKANTLAAQQCMKELWVSLRFAESMNVTQADVTEFGHGHGDPVDAI